MRISEEEFEMIKARVKSGKNKMPVSKKKSKYHSEKTEIDGIVFDSRKEAQRYALLRIMERAGEISDLILQPKFELIPKFERNGKKYRASYYIADFQYKMDGKIIIEDTKGFKTEVYKLKIKFLLWKYPNLNFQEV